MVPALILSMWVTIYSRKTRYTYCGVVDNELDLMSGIVKYDLYLDPSTTDTAVDDKTKGNNCTVFHFGPNCYASDTIFVPNNRGMANDAAEDDGFLISFVQDLNTGYGLLIIITKLITTMGLQEKKNVYLYFCFFLSFLKKWELRSTNNWHGMCIGSLKLSSLMQRQWGQHQWQL